MCHPLAYSIKKTKSMATQLTNQRSESIHIVRRPVTKWVNQREFDRYRGIEGDTTCICICICICICLYIYIYIYVGRYLRMDVSELCSMVRHILLVVDHMCAHCGKTLNVC